jgi:ABC-type uncharacterized transport system permease subunit
MRYQQPLTVVLFILISLIVSASLLSLFSVSPLNGILTLFAAGFNPGQGVVQTLKVSAPLIIMAVGLSIPFTAGVWNIGGQGQFVIGSILATWLGTSVSTSLPAPLVILLAMIAGFVGGAIWAIPPTLMKIHLGVSEVITTLMMNFVAVYFLDYLLSGPLEGAQARIYHDPTSAPIPLQFKLPVLFPGTSLTLDIVIAVLIAGGLFFLLGYTRLGYELKVIGANKEAAEYGGIRINRNILFSMVISGGVAGVAGMAEVYGTSGILLPQVFSDITTSFGYVGIPVALIASLNPLVIIVSSVFFAGIITGVYGMESIYGIPLDLVTTIYGLIMFFALLGVYVNLDKVLRFVRRVPAVSRLSKEVLNE